MRKREREEMIPISVCIIAKNEEEFMEECLKRLKPYGFELIIVDTGSEDNTKAIAGRYTEEIYNFAWCNDFSKARNFAASKASNDWILSIDCDEHLQDIDIEKLTEIMQQQENACGTVRILSPTSKKQDAAVSISDIKRFYNRNKFHYAGPIHEQLVDENGRIAAEYQLPVTLFHHGYALEGEKKKAKQDRNISMLKAQIKREGETPYLLFQLGRSYRMLEDYKKALPCFEKAITMEFDPAAIYGKLLITDYAQTLLDLGEYKKALRIEMLKDVFGDFADYVFMLGRVYYSNKQPVKALQQFIKVMGMSEGILKGTTTYLAYYMLTCLYRDMGEEQMEQIFWQKYLETAPGTN